MNTLESFSKSVKDILKDASICNKIQLNGSFNSSYWASDIDLYEDCKGMILEIALKKMKSFAEKYPLTGIKIVTMNGKVEKPSKLPKELPKDLSMVKLDLIFRGLTFPIDCSVIYDWQSDNTYNVSRIIETFADEMAKKKYSLYKALKRCETLGQMLGYKFRMFRNIMDNTSIGVQYLSAMRLDMMKENKKSFTSKELKKMKDTIQEDLRRVSVQMPPRLDSKRILRDLDKQILKLL